MDKNKYNSFGTLVIVGLVSFIMGYIISAMIAINAFS